jgi:hypothetical protein
MKNNHTLIFIAATLFVIGTSGVFGQSIKRAYKSMEKQDYVKAHEDFKAILSKEKNNPGALFGLTYLYGFEKFGHYDIFQAWKQMDITKKSIKSLNAEDAEAINEYFVAIGNRVGNANYKINKYLDEIEENMLRTMREENNLEVVNQFLEEFKDFENFENIVHIRNYLEYRKAEQENNLAAILNFIKMRPDAAQVEMAKEKRNELAFQEAKQKNTSQAFENFITSYPDALQVPEAITFRNRLEFEKVQLTNNFDAYQQYIEKYPSSMYIPQIKEKQKKLVYEEARKINTIEAYNRFISMYPDGAQYIDIFNLKTVELGKSFNASNTLFSGEPVWSLGYDHEEQDNMATDFCMNAQGEIIIAGATMQDDTSAYFDAWIIKLDKNRKMLWNKIIGERLHDVPSKIIADTDGNIIVGGVINKQSDTLGGQAWIFKLDPNGGKIWNRKLDMPEILSMDVNSKGDIILGGYQLNDTVPENYVLYKLTPQGRKFWRRSYSTFGKVNDISITPTDDILIAGSQWVWKLNNQGYLAWEMDIAENDSIASLAQLGNGNIALLGRRDSNQCLIKIISPQGKPILENSFGANATRCLPIDIVSRANDMVFAIQLDGFNKLLYSSLNGELKQEYDFSPGVVSRLEKLHPAHTGNIMLLITADNLGQGKDIIITELK